MIPQAGAILAIRGKFPAKSAETPSLRTTFNKRGMVPETRLFDDDINSACRRVLSTSNGEVIKAASIPLEAPLTNATQVPEWPRRRKDFLMDS